VEVKFRMSEALDTRKVLPGKQGKLFTGTGKFLAQVNTFQVQINVTNTDYQPAGQALVQAVMISYTVTLTFTETVIKDADLFQKFMTDIRAGKQPDFDFQGVITGHNGSENREVFRRCVPDGAIDLQNVSIGDIINRAWSFRVNEVPDMQSYLDQ
jgi:hypothetical protein